MHQCQTKIWRQSYGEGGKTDFISSPGKGEHSRLEPQELCSLPHSWGVCVWVCAHVHTHAHTQLHLTLCDPMDSSSRGSSVQGFSRQEYWSGLPIPSPGALPNPGIKSVSPALQVMPLLLGHLGSPPLGNRERICIMCSYTVHKVPDEPRTSRCTSWI